MIKKVKLGEVLIDSGTLLFVDPLRIRDDWRNIGVIDGIVFWGPGKDQLTELLRNRQIEVIEGMRYNRVKPLDEPIVRELLLLVEQPVLLRYHVNHSLELVRDSRNGEVEHLGGVAVETNFGFYSVYGVYENEELRKVEIILDEE